MLQNRNRVIALKLAVEHRGANENTESILERAKRYEEYLEGPGAAEETSSKGLFKRKKTAAKG